MAFVRAHALVAVTPDNPDYEIRPSHWNQDHALSGATSGGIPYFSSTTGEASSALLAANSLVIGGGAGAAPFTSANLTFVAATGTLTASGPFLSGNGSSGAPAHSFSSDVSTGFYRWAASAVTLSLGGSKIFSFEQGIPQFRINSAASCSWTSTTDSEGVVDSNLSRIAAGVLGVGTGAAGSVAGTLSLVGIELGHASDTTVSRSAAGVVAVEGVVIPSISSTNTLTNKRVTKRVTTEVSSATPTINTDNADVHTISALALAITSMSTNLSGTPTAEQSLLIRIKDDGTARAITWGASFTVGDIALPTTTVISKYLYCSFLYNTTLVKWVLTGKLDNVA